MRPRPWKSRPRPSAAPSCTIPTPPPMSSRLAPSTPSATSTSIRRLGAALGAVLAVREQVAARLFGVEVDVVVDGAAVLRHVGSLRLAAVARRILRRMRESISLPDGRRLDLFAEGPAGGTPLLFHHGSPASALPDPAFVAALAEHDLRYVGVEPSRLRRLDAPTWPSRGGRGGRCGRRAGSRRCRSGLHPWLVGRGTACHGDWRRGCRTGSWARPPSAAWRRTRRRASTGSRAWDRRTSRSSVRSLEGPEALIAYKERAWPVWSVVTGGRDRRGVRRADR